MTPTLTTLARWQAIEAWHFLPADRRTRYSSELVEAGTVLHIDGRPILCERGLHASVRAIDALDYAPGPIACRVRIWGDVIRGDDKLAGTYRECVAMVDATTTLHEFACCVAEAALLIADVTDERCWRAIEAKRAWLRGDLDDQGLAAARDAAAWAAAGAAAARDAAAWAAAGAAAARDAAARDAAAWAAARDGAAWAAARGEQNATLESMLLEAL